MLIIIFIFSVLIILGACWLFYISDKRNSYIEAPQMLMITFGIFLLIASTGGMIWNGIQVQESFVVQERIDMYEEQNNKIETDMSEMVSSYMQYEGQTFKDVTKDNAMQLVEIYPNLKTNELVKSNMELHQQNIKTINELKDRQIHYKIAKWWLYFGN